MKILITGANGTVGQDLIKQLKASPENEISATDKDILDITDFSATNKFILQTKPDLVIHLAAATDVDWCETHREECLKINLEATKNLAQASLEAQATFVFPSTTYVYPAEEGAVYDDRKDQPSLEKVNGVYSRSKLLAEIAIQEIFGAEGKYFIVRFGQLFGGGEDDKKFVGKILKIAHSQGMVRAVSDRFIQPTGVSDTVKNLIALIKTNHYGVYNLVSHGQASYYDYAREIVKGVGLESVKVVPVLSSEFKETAPRPKNLNCVNGKLQDLGLDLMQDWREGLKEYLSS